MKCPNCNIELVKSGNESKCPNCIYSFVHKVQKSTGKGNKYIQQVNRAIKDMLIEARLTDDPVPWKQPWIIIPKRNYDSNRVYNGINRWLLSYSNDISFVTQKSIEKKGLKLNKEATGNYVICWIPPRLKEEEKKLSKAKQDKILRKRFPIMVTHIVYKSKDVEGLKEKSFETDQENDRIQSIEDFLKTTGIEFKSGGNKAAYNWTNDYITVPRIEQFNSTEEYYRTVLHELAHATGHKDRLNRDSDKFKRFEEYGKEELIAEMASAYMCMYFGIEPDENTTAYIDEWLKAIDSDPYLLLSAGQQAEKVIEYFKLV